MHIDLAQLHAERRSCSPNYRPLSDADLTLNFTHDTDARDLRRDLPEQLQPLGAQAKFELGALVLQQSHTVPIVVAVDPVRSGLINVIAEPALDAPPAPVEGLHLRPGLGIGVGVCHRLPARIPRATVIAKFGP